jgi:hypothetical protein
MRVLSCVQRWRDNKYVNVWLPELVWVFSAHELEDPFQDGWMFVSRIEDDMVVVRRVFDNQYA